jgi:N-acetylneuraminate synthase
LSDHTLDNTTALASVALGASIIEKHFTLDRAGGGPDDSFSLEPEGLRELCRNARTAWEAMGTVNYGRKSSEIGSVKFRRSLYFVRSLKAGDQVPADAVRSVRPGFGLEPKHLDAVVGSVLKTDVDYGIAVTWDHLEH